MQLISTLALAASASALVAPVAPKASTALKGATLDDQLKKIPGVSPLKNAPADYGFDPLGFASDPKKLEELQMKELANGRLAMFAFGGFVTQSVITGGTFPYMYDDTMNLLTGTGLTLG